MTWYNWLIVIVPLTIVLYMAVRTRIAMYCLISYLTCRRPFNLERMLHRGKYADAGEVKQFEKLTWRSLSGQ